MTVLNCVHTGLTWLGFCLGVVSAYYWFRASTAKVTDENNRYDPGMELTYEDPDEKGRSIHVVATAMEQSRLNMIAALLTGLAVLCQAIASLFPRG